MKKIYLFSMLLLLMTSMVINAQILSTTFKGAFAPAPEAMWTNNWTNFDPQNAVYPLVSSAISVSANITTNTTWTTGNTYYLRNQVYVTNNATLTIEPGVVIFGDKSAVGAGLFITKGSKLNAIGTATQPIVFTSDQPAGLRDKGDWGGVILLGKSNFNVSGGPTPVQPGINNIEGIVASSLTQYGGGASPDLADNSGTMKYVRIEFAGYVYGANQEINGLTFGSVGSGTTIDYIQVSFANDDAFEWFGGSVNCSHLVSFRNLDDDFDTDNGFSGSVQFCLAVRDPQIADNPSVSTSEGFESDNNATSVAGTSFTSAIFTNCTMVGPKGRLAFPNGGVLASGYKRGARLRRNTQLKIYNSLFLDFKEGLNIDGLTTETNAVNNQLIFKNNIQAVDTPAYAETQVTSGSPAVTVITYAVAAKFLELYVNFKEKSNTTTPVHDPNFNISNWYTAGGNTIVPTSNGILTKLYDTTNATVYTGLDYRPATAGGADTGASFTDTFLAAKVTGSFATTNFNVEDAVNTFKVYPNAFASTFKLSFATTSSENATVAVYALDGKLVESRTIAASDIDTAEFGATYATGSYVVKIKQGATTKVTRAIKK
jgi:hypothetical protein